MSEFVFKNNRAEFPHSELNALTSADKISCSAIIETLANASDDKRRIRLRHEFEAWLTRNGWAYRIADDSFHPIDVKASRDRDFKKETKMTDKIDPRIFTVERYDRLVNETFEKIKELARLKGGEYSGDLDRLANFRRGAANEGVDYRLVWKIYISKHWDAIAQYVRDITAGREARVRLESLEGRVDDMIVYLLLFKAMLQENDESTSSKPFVLSEEIAMTKRRPEYQVRMKEETGLASALDPLFRTRRERYDITTDTWKEVPNAD